MSEMVDRVAKAIDEANICNLADWGVALSDPAIREIARAAIAAMRDATECDDVVYAGLYDAEGFNLLGVTANSLCAAYERMIDAMLADETMTAPANPKPTTGA